LVGRGAVYLATFEYFIGVRCKEVEFYLKKQQLESASQKSYSKLILLVLGPDSLVTTITFLFGIDS
jgi:hypothetical protein